VPQTAGGGWSANDLAAIAVWGVIGLVVAARRLRTEPVTGDGRARRDGWALAAAARRPGLR
jgi:hypothetical protein